MRDLVRRPAPRLARVRAEQLKQLVKNGVYRTLGEAASAIGAVERRRRPDAAGAHVPQGQRRPGEPALRPGRACSTSRWRSCARSATRSSISTPCSTTTRADGRCRDGAVLITFDDGYRDNLENARAVLAALRLPGRPVRADRLPRRRAAAAARGAPRAARAASTARSAGTSSPSSSARGIRVESHGISHRPLAALEVDEAAREIALSKLRLEERLGRPVRAFAYVKGSEAHYRPVHLSLLAQAGYEVAFTSVSGANGPGTDPLRLHRYNVEPYPPRTFELVLAGACDLIAREGHGRGNARAAAVQRRARHVDQVSA